MVRSQPDAVAVTFVSDGCVGLDTGVGVVSGTGLTHLRAIAEGLGGILTAE